MSYNINLNYKQPQTWKFGLYEKNWTKGLDKYVSTVAPLCTFLRIENRTKIKKTRILFLGNWILERKTK